MTLIRNEKTVNILSLLASTSTLICCAIPAFFVFLGAGATLASLVTTFPFLISLSSYKTSITITTFLILLIVGYLNYRTYYLPCPTDPVLRQACAISRRKSRLLYYFSVTIFLFSTTFTYVIPRIF